MALGLIPNRGNWDYQEFNTASAATFLKGSLVMLDGARNVNIYTSTSSHYLGIAMQDSVNSKPAGKVQVALPRAGCTAFSDITTAVGTSATSIGQAYGLTNPGNVVSFVTTLATSVFSRIVTIVGPVDSATSRVEVAFVQNEALIWSTSSVSIV